MQLSERMKSLLSPLNMHLAGAVLLLALNIYLVIQLVINIGLAHNQNALDEQRLRLSAATVAAQPLRGLDQKLDVAKSDAAAFENLRLPADYSTVAAELGDIAHHNNVRLTRVEYPGTPAPNGLTELSMDASLTGDYRRLVQFINSIERDKLFFVIDDIALSGQQGGIVTLKIRITTWLSSKFIAGTPTTASVSAGSKTSAAMEGQ
jgi:Tfp pilus assembly protein PilO